MKGPGRSPSTGGEAAPSALDASPASPHRASLPGGAAELDVSAGPGIGGPGIGGPAIGGLSGPELARLIGLAQGGDTAAFERLIGVYQGKIYGFARAYSSDASEAADLAQEALIKVYRSLHSFRFQSSLLTWMFRIVKNVALDHYRSRQQRERRREQPLDGLSEGDLRGGSPPGSKASGDPEDQLLADEERQALWAALARVPEVYRTVVVLTDMQGLSYEEVAAIVGSPVGTVKSRLNRGRDALREVLLSGAGTLAAVGTNPTGKERS